VTKTLLILYASQTGASRQLAEAAADGASAAGECAVRLLRAEDAEEEDMLSADGVIFAFPENLAAISGTMKAFFDRTYYPCLGKVGGRAYALMIAAGSDGSNAVRQAERILTGWRMKAAAPARIVLTHAQTAEDILAPKLVAVGELDAARHLGAAMAAGLAMGIF
jgi:multimeric flavodoxin WrbA